MAKLFTKGQVAAAQFRAWHGRRFNDVREVAIIKAGPSWATFRVGGTEYRASQETGVIDGGGYTSPGRLWQSMAEYRAHADLALAWAGLTAAVRDMREPPPGCSAADIVAAAQLLKVGL